VTCGRPSLTRISSPVAGGSASTSSDSERRVR
jgi:hypothetical protein